MGNETNSASSWRERVLALHAPILEQIKNAPRPDLDDLTWERMERIQHLEAARAFDKQATLSEEFVMRLQGEAATGAGFNLEWEGLLRPLQDAVALQNPDARLELTGFSKGSSVLHFRAAKRGPLESIDSEKSVPVQETPLSSPARKFIDFVDDIENERDLGPWLDSNMLPALERIAGELQSLELQAEFRYYARSGDVRGSQLSGRGMQYIRSLNEKREVPAPLSISGRISELRQSGHAKVKAGTARNATAYDVLFDSGMLTEMRLVLGQNVHWQVEQVSTIDQLGRVQETRFQFLADLGVAHQDQLGPSDGFWPEESKD